MRREQLLPLRWSTGPFSPPGGREGGAQVPASTATGAGYHEDTLPTPAPASQSGAELCPHLWAEHRWGRRGSQV